MSEGMWERLRARGALVDEGSRVGFITAMWASVGVAFLASSAFEHGDVLSKLDDSWQTFIPFLLGTYGMSYVAGRMFLWRGVSQHIVKSWLMAALVSSLVLGAGTMAGALGQLLHKLLIGQTLVLNNLNILWIPAFMVLFGQVFTLPLSLGLGLHVRLWRHFRERAAIEG